MKGLNPVVISGREVLPLVEGGKGISVSNGESSGAWGATGGVGTFSGVNADSYTEDGQPIPQVYRGRTRLERHEELVSYAIAGGIQQARVAHERSGGQGRIHMNVLWEMAAAERVLHGVLEGARGIIHGVTCGAGMPYKIAEICASYGVYYYPIVSSARAFRALWKRAYYRFCEWLGGVVYEDPWLAGGHNGLSNSEDPERPEPPYPRVRELRSLMVDFGLAMTPIFMAGGVWYLREWTDWIDNPELGPIAFQFGTRPLVTQESPISEVWKRKLLTLDEGDVSLNRFSPTGFYSSAVHNAFLNELRERSARQVAYTVALSRRTSRVIRQNLIFAVGVITTLVVATLLGHLRLPLAVVGHEGSTVLVVLNGLRLLAAVPNTPRGSSSVSNLQAPLSGFSRTQGE